MGKSSFHIKSLLLCIKQLSDQIDQLHQSSTELTPSFVPAYPTPQRPAILPPLCLARKAPAHSIIATPSHQQPPKPSPPTYPTQTPQSHLYATSSVTKPPAMASTDAKPATEPQETPDSKEQKPTALGEDDEFEDFPVDGTLPISFSSPQAYCIFASLSELV